MSPSSTDSACKSQKRNNSQYFSRSAQPLYLWVSPLKNEYHEKARCTMPGNAADYQPYDMLGTGAAKHIMLHLCLQVWSQEVSPATCSLLSRGQNLHF